MKKMSVREVPSQPQGEMLAVPTVYSHHELVTRRYKQNAAPPLKSHRPEPAIQHEHVNTTEPYPESSWSQTGH